MPGTKAGSQKALATLLARHPDHFKRMGQKGGASHSKGGFNDRALAKRAGHIGGKVSNRTGIKNGEGKIHQTSYHEVEGEV